MQAFNRFPLGGTWKELGATCLSTEEDLYWLSRNNSSFNHDARILTFIDPRVEDMGTRIYADERGYANLQKLDASIIPSSFYHYIRIRNNIAEGAYELKDRCPNSLSFGLLSTLSLDKNVYLGSVMLKERGTRVGDEYIITFMMDSTTLKSTFVLPPYPYLIDGIIKDFGLKMENYLAKK